jgi:K+-sensing histidine kinase KdpD
VKPGGGTEMNISRRVVVSLLIVAIVLFLGLLFWPFILTNIIQPTALVIWFLLRILVLGIHQKYFWYALIIVAFLVLFRLLPPEQPTIQADRYLETNTTMVNIGYWRGLFTYNGQDIRDENTLKRELMHLLASLYASKQRTPNNFGIYDAMQQGRIPLPGKIHAFLFSQEPAGSGRPIKKFFRSIRETPRKWIRQWTGQEKAEHFQMINEVLEFMGTSLEIKDDDGKPSQNKH